MIAYLKGKVIKKTAKSLILNTGNIGYEIFVSKTLLSQNTEKSEKEFYIYSHIREDSFDLYGFEKYEDLSFFKQLININGIGPKAGLEILNSAKNKIKSAIISEDIALICQVPGIGKKTAQRLVLELKDKLSIDNTEEISLSPLSAHHEDAMEALLNLGYQRHEIKRTLKKAPQEVKEAEEIITFFLKHN